MEKAQRKNYFTKFFNQRIGTIEELVAASNSFFLIRSDAEILKKNFDSMSQEVRSAFSRAFIVTYAKPFLSENNGSGSGKFMSVKYLTKAGDFDTDLHSGLLELRNTLVGHRSNEKTDMRMFSSPANSDAGNPKVKRVFIPHTWYFQASSLLGFKKEILERLAKHSNLCYELTLKEAEEACRRLRDTIVEYADVGDRDSRIIILDGEPIPTLESAHELFDREIPQVSLANELDFQVIQFRVGVPLNINYENEYFSIKMEQNNKGTATGTITFKDI